MTDAREIAAGRIALRPLGNNAFGLPSFAVTLDGTEIGTVSAYYPTIEREIPGKRYVAWRRKSKTRHWIAEYPNCPNTYRCPYRTRKEAIKDIVAVRAVLMED